ncbi:uroporphyrinogen decarboxylase [Candidatus Epulonipiscium fishelsonii]|uniref:Uroporphyrinogen decarboxylase n=1 Tax=Candidatus Epulonipiscium fishelsonii TaxID=77094 RepID=A0ACC8XFE3_9FIRM|nr:uroporphyrinogen decarboxylase [Epulopiscium sp. SCG-B05WGA-EpuloA1]ONI41950.1 uroporphyrinogen decarboxylase [Epulopiscium sp. SCG-B11WGA-EpuloA1]
MTPKQSLFDVLDHKKVAIAPWVPFAGVHAGKLVGYNATEVLTNKDKLVKSLLEVNKLYKPNGQPVVFDLQLEAEILGCELVFADDGPPSVKTHPLEDIDTIPCECKLPTAEDGRLPIVLAAMREMKEKVGDTTALYGLICGPFTLASHLRGTNIFMDMYDDEDYVKSLLDYCLKVAKRMTDLFIEAGMDIIAVVDPLVSQISPDHFEEFLDAPFSALFKYIKEKGAYSSFFVCGDATKNIDVMCKTKPDSISVDENVDLAAAKKITDKHNIAIGGNIPLTSVMLHGTQEDNMKYVIDLVDKIEDTTNLIIAPGCDMPYDTPIENTIAITQAVTEPEVAHKILENYTVVVEDIYVELPDYASLKKPLIEVCTLDSLTCAACTYMMAAVNRVKEDYGDAIDVIEYKFTIKENIARFQKMGVTNLPAIYINGELKFSSIIPSNEELHKAIDEAKAKMK